MRQVGNYNECRTKPNAKGAHHEQHHADRYYPHIICLWRRLLRPRTLVLNSLPSAPISYNSPLEFGLNSYLHCRIARGPPRLNCKSLAAGNLTKWC